MTDRPDGMENKATATAVPASVQPPQRGVDGDGIIEVLAAVTGVEDEVGDIIEPGAFTKTLKKRRPKVCLGHDWNRPIGKVLDIYELMPGDPRLPKTTADGRPWPKEAGALWSRAQINLDSDDGRAAYSAVKFYGMEESTYSIGYRPVNAYHKTVGGRRIRFLPEVDLFEFGPVLHPANTLATLQGWKGEADQGMTSQTDAASLEDVETKVRYVRDASYWGYPVGTPIQSWMKPKGSAARSLRRQGKVPSRNVGLSGEKPDTEGRETPKQRQRAVDEEGLFPEEQSGPALRVRATKPKGNELQYVSDLVQHFDDRETTARGRTDLDALIDRLDDLEATDPDDTRGRPGKDYVVFERLLEEGMTPAELDEDMRTVDWGSDESERAEIDAYIDAVVDAYASAYNRLAQAQASEENGGEKPKPAPRKPRAQKPQPEKPAAEEEEPAPAGEPEAEPAPTAEEEAAPEADAAEELRSKLPDVTEVAAKAKKLATGRGEAVRKYSGDEAAQNAMLSDVLSVANTHSFPDGNIQAGNLKAANSFAEGRETGAELGRWTLDSEMLSPEGAQANAARVEFMADVIDATGLDLGDKGRRASQELRAYAATLRGDQPGEGDNNNRPAPAAVEEEQPTGPAPDTESISPDTEASVTTEEVDEAADELDAILGLVESVDGELEVDADVADRQDRVEALLGRETGDLTQESDDALTASRRDLIDELRLQEAIARRDRQRPPQPAPGGEEEQPAPEVVDGEEEGGGEGEQPPPAKKPKPKPAGRPGLAGAAEDLADALESGDDNAKAAAVARVQSALRRSRSDSDAVQALRNLLGDDPSTVDPAALRDAVAAVRTETRDKRNKRARDRRAAKRLERDRIRSLIGQYDAELRRRHIDPEEFGGRLPAGKQDTPPGQLRAAALTSEPWRLITPDGADGLDARQQQAASLAFRELARDYAPMLADATPEELDAAGAELDRRGVPRTEGAVIGMLLDPDGRREFVVDLRAAMLEHQRLLADDEPEEAPQPTPNNPGLLGGRVPATVERLTGGQIHAGDLVVVPSRDGGVLTGNVLRFVSSDSRDARSAHLMLEDGSVRLIDLGDDTPAVRLTVRGDDATPNGLLIQVGDASAALPVLPPGSRVQLGSLAHNDNGEQQVHPIATGVVDTGPDGPIVRATDGRVFAANELMKRGRVRVWMAAGDGEKLEPSKSARTERKLTAKAGDRVKVLVETDGGGEFWASGWVEREQAPYGGDTDSVLVRLPSGAAVLVSAYGGKTDRLRKIGGPTAQTQAAVAAEEVRAGLFGRERATITARPVANLQTKVRAMVENRMVNEDPTGATLRALADELESAEAQPDGSSIAIGDLKVPRELGFLFDGNLGEGEFGFFGTEPSDEAKASAEQFAREFAVRLLRQAADSVDEFAGRDNADRSAALRAATMTVNSSLVANRSRLALIRAYGDARKRGEAELETDGEDLPDVSKLSAFGERVAALRKAMGEGTFGTAPITRYRLAADSLDTAADGHVELVAQTDERVDIDQRDGGPGPHMRRHTALLRAMGHEIRMEAQARYAAKLESDEQYRADVALVGDPESNRQDADRLIGLKEDIREAVGKAAEEAALGTSDSVMLRMLLMRDPQGDKPRDPAAAARLSEEARRLWPELDAQLRPQLEQYWALDRKTNDRASELMAAHTRKQNAERRFLSEARREALAEVRELGPSGDKRLPWQVGKANDDKSKADIESAMEWAMGHYPTDWLGHASGTRLNVGVYNARGYYSGLRGVSGATINVGARNGHYGKGIDGGPYNRVTIHELGHHMEANVPGLVRAEWALHYERTTTGEPGSRKQERVRRMSALRPGMGYSKGETTYADEWPEPYTGKTYNPVGAPSHDDQAFEVFQTAVESLFAGSEYLDEDLENWALGALAGLR